MFVTIITDCRDSSERARQITRASVLFPGANVTLVGTSNFAEIESAGILIDVLDASLGQKGIVLVNAAPRHGEAKKYENGTPFGYFWVGDTLVSTTVAGYTLSLAKKFNLIENIKVTEISVVLEDMIQKGIFLEKDKDRVIKTQFRSFEYLPYMAKWVFEGRHIPYEDYEVEYISNISHLVWWIDNFGNVKTTMLPEEVAFESGKSLSTKLGKFTCYSRLKDVPNDNFGIVIGSSGYGNQRFLEIVAQGKSAAQLLHISIGDVL